jgi:hypothetical protein
LGAIDSTIKSEVEEQRCFVSEKKLDGKKRQMETPSWCSQAQIEHHVTTIVSGHDGTRQKSIEVGDSVIRFPLTERGGGMERLITKSRRSHFFAGWNPLTCPLVDTTALTCHGPHVVDEEALVRNLSCMIGLGEDLLNCVLRVTMQVAVVHKDLLQWIQSLLLQF